MIKAEQSFKKADWLSAVSEKAGVTKKNVDDVFSAIEEVIAAHLKQGLECSWNGLLKFHTVEKKATPEREITNRFTGGKMTVPAKPAHKAVQVKKLKKLKEIAD